MMHFFSRDTLPISRWRNGGGETREVVSFPPGIADFSWRISIATLAADGPFSLFPGIDRVITLLEGDGVSLYTNDEEKQRLVRHRPFAFAGEEAIFCRLTGSISSDFNVMTRRATHCASVAVHNDTFAPVPESAGVVYVLSGEWSLGERRLTPDRGAWWDAGDGALLRRESVSASLLAVTLARRQAEK
ncbi:HutD/Ves family protein [Erwinia oleae]|uniref:HutD/Ves family protein n=1 Tax=Erwinia oleae TaxID=796334 RepID=UPI000553B387|nr:HutD family protein [Erwinia oleae]